MDECPKGYACQGGICGPTSCSRNSDCPAGLSCTNRGCVSPPPVDAGDVDGNYQLPNEFDGGGPEIRVPDVAAAADAILDAPAFVDGGQE
jgi:hypothetical protein